MKNNTLYIHGLDSFPHSHRITAINKHSNTSAHHIDYEKQTDVFKFLSEQIVKQKITHIIGSSLGGYLGFYLAEKHGLPCLLFNPALHNRTIEVPVEEGNYNCPSRFVVLGDEDDVVSPDMTIEFLMGYKYLYEPKTKQRMIVCKGLGHRIDRETFAEMIKYFYS